MNKLPKYSKRLGKLEEDDTYFNERGLVVFTEKYHLKRGYCCKSGCKHCPYGYKIDLSIKKGGE